MSTSTYSVPSDNAKLQPVCSSMCPLPSQGKNLLNQVTPRSPLALKVSPSASLLIADLPSTPLQRKPVRGIHTCTSMIGPAIVASPRMNQQLGSENSLINKEELSSYKDTYHHRFTNPTSFESKHREMISKQPKAFVRQMGDSEKYLVAAAYQDRGFSWKRSDKRVSTGGFQSSFLVPTLSLDPIDVDLFSIARTVQHSNAKSLKTRHTDSRQIKDSIGQRSLYSSLQSRASLSRSLSFSPMRTHSPIPDGPDDHQSQLLPSSQRKSQSPTTHIHISDAAFRQNRVVDVVKWDSGWSSDDSLAGISIGSVSILTGGSKASTTKQHQRKIRRENIVAKEANDAKTQIAQFEARVSSVDMLKSYSKNDLRVMTAAAKSLRKPLPPSPSPSNHQSQHLASDPLNWTMSTPFALLTTEEKNSAIDSTGTFDNKSDVMYEDINKDRVEVNKKKVVLDDLTRSLSYLKMKPTLSLCAVEFPIVICDVDIFSLSGGTVQLSFFVHPKLQGGEREKGREESDNRSKLGDEIGRCLLTREKMQSCTVPLPPTLTLPIPPVDDPLLLPSEVDEKLKTFVEGESRFKAEWLQWSQNLMLRLSLEWENGEGETEGKDEHKNTAKHGNKGRGRVE